MIESLGTRISLSGIYIFVFASLPLQVTITVGFYAGISLLEAGCNGNQTSWCGGVVLVEYAVRCFIMLITVVAINFNITNIRFCIQVKGGSLKGEGVRFLFWCVAEILTL